MPLVHAAALSVLDPGWFGPLRARRWPQRNCECEAGCCARQLRRRRYRLQRGLVLGNAELDRAPKPDAHYVPHLQGQVACMTMLDTASQGRLDAAGIAPERHAVRRRGRDTCAASFQREAGKIAFSGPTHELPLQPGAQGRLSWMLRLPAIVATAPERFLAGASVVLFVAGARAATPMSGPASSMASRCSAIGRR